MATTLIIRNGEPMPLEDFIYAGESLAKIHGNEKDGLLSKERSNIMSY